MPKLKSRIVLWMFCIIPFILPGGAECSEVAVFSGMWPVMEASWYFSRPRDLASDSKGFIYIADTENDQIQKFTRDGQFVSKWGRKGSDPGNFILPSAICIDIEGYIYVADTGNHRIQKFDGKGKLIAVWGSEGAGNGEFRGPMGVAADHRGLLYVADTENHRIQQFTTNGKFLAAWGGNGNHQGRFDYPMGVAVDENGNIYVADTDNDRIQVFDYNGTVIQVWGETGDAPGQLQDPHGITVGTDGRIYVTDIFNHRIQRFTPDGVYIDGWGGFGNSDARFNVPHGITLDDRGRLYVADQNNNRIQVFSIDDGRLTGIWGIRNQPGEFNEPQDIALHPDGYVFVADTFNHRIQKFTSDGGFLLQWGQSGGGNGEFREPWGIAAADDGTIYVADSGNHRVQKFDAQGGFMASWGSMGGGEGAFFDPRDVAVDSLGNIYVLDSGNARVQKLSGSGNFILEWGSLGENEGQFSHPVGIDIDDNGFVYVADAGNHRIQKFTSEGDFQSQWREGGSAADQFYLPYGVAVDAAGTVYVADTGNHRLRAISQNGELTDSIGEPGTDPGHFNYPGGVAINDNGVIYVADSLNHRVQVFEKHPLKPTPKAIIVAGGGPYPGNYLWDATRLTTHYAYRALTYQGFSKETIFLMHPETDLDLDNNGKPDDVDAVPSLSSLKNALDSWARDAESLILYLTDHGKNDTFRLSETEVLEADALDGMIDDLHKETDIPVVVIIDACNSGSFQAVLTPMAQKDRWVITSSTEDETAVFINQGALSFSGFFWSSIFSGNDISTAFRSATEILAGITDGQHPLLNGDGDLNYNETEDFRYLEELPLTGQINYNKDYPVISGLFEDTEIAEAPASLLIFASEVSDRDGIARVWANIAPQQLIQSSSEQITLQLPTVELHPSTGNRYEAIYEGFGIDGVYRVTLFAMDTQGNVTAAPKRTVRVNTPATQKAVLVAGFSAVADFGNTIGKTAETAYRALKTQGFADNDIYYLASDIAKEGVDDVPSVSNIEYAVKTWGTDGNEDVFVYFIGETGHRTFIAQEGQSVSATVLGGWLDEVQQKISGALVVGLEGDASGAFIPDLTGAPEDHRVVVTSAADKQAAVFLFDGDLSFSGFFFANIAAGMNLHECFTHAKSNIAFITGLSGNDLPFIDDNGNGIANEYTDGRIAAGIHIGEGLRLTGDTPAVTSASPDIIVSDDASAVIWAENITGIDAVASVGATVTLPANAAGEISSYPLNLFPTGNGRYEGVWNHFPFYGLYEVVIYAKDIQGNLSSPQHLTIAKINGPDGYENDDSTAKAVLINVNDPVAQRRNFHKDGDADWMKFYGVRGSVYSIRADDPEDRCDIVIKLFDSQLSPISHSGDWRCPKNDTYYIRCRNIDGSVFGDQTGYSLSVSLPVGVLTGYLRGAITDEATRAPVSGATIVTSAAASAFSRPSGQYLIVQEPGHFSVMISKSGYEEKQLEIDVSEGGVTQMDISLAPTVPPVIDTIPQASITSPESAITVDAGESVFFDGMVKNGNPPFSLLWTFDNAAPDSTVISPGFIVFGEPGVYPATFTVTDDDGDTDTGSVTVTVNALPGDTSPTVAIRQPESGQTILKDDPLNFSASITDGNPPFSFLWTDSAGNSLSTEENPDNIVFSTIGEIIVTLAVTDADGDIGTDVVTIYVTGNDEDLTPSATILSPPSAVEIQSGESVDFTGSAASGNPPYTYVWDFDGGAENVYARTAESIMFDSTGTYIVTFIVTDSDGDASAPASVTVTVRPALRPDRPAIVYPENTQSGVSLTPEIETSPYSHPYPEYFHAATRWQIAADNAFSSMVIDIESETDLTALRISDRILEPLTPYYIRVQYTDSADAPSLFSDPVEFTTGEPIFSDDNSNGVPDEQETDDRLDLDGNGVADTEEGLPSLITLTGNTRITVHASANVRSIMTVQSISAEEIQDRFDISENLPFGMIGFKIELENAGDTGEILMYFARNLPGDGAWIVCDDIRNCLDYSNHIALDSGGTPVRLEFQDGGFGDADGTANGIVVITSGMLIDDADREIPPLSEHDVGSSGCLIETCRLQ